MLVVIDAGVWVSAFQYGGLPLIALKLAFLNHRLASCQQIDAEVERVLWMKFGRAGAETRQALEEYLANAHRVITTGAVKGVCRDPKDDMVLECAALVEADIIVTGDRDLLVLGSYARTTILTARQFLDADLNLLR